MKKLFAVLFLVAAALWVQGQTTQFGLKAGFNSSAVDQENAPDYESRSGFHAGGLAHIHINRHFAVQPELVYSAQNSEAPNGNKLNLNYINVPVLAQFMVHNGFRLQTGPQVGFLVSSEAETSQGEVDVDGYQTIDFGWTLGASYVFASGLGIDARYNIGLTDISELSTVKAKNRVLQLGLFYQFKGNNKTHK